MCCGNKDARSPREVSHDNLFLYTSARMDREVDTARARMTRMLYVNGFLFSVLALIEELATSFPTFTQTLLFAIPFAGAIISISSYFSLRASQGQRDAIKVFWEGQEFTDKYPPFFAGPKKESDDN